MSQLVYTTPKNATRGKPAPLPSIREILHSPIPDVETLLAARPEYCEGIASMISFMVAHECRAIGF